MASRRCALCGGGGLTDVLEENRLDACAIGEGDLLRLIGTILLVLPPSESTPEPLSARLGRSGSDGDKDEIEDCEARWLTGRCARTDSAQRESADGETGERAGLGPPVMSEDEFSKSGRGPE